MANAPQNATRKAPFVIDAPPAYPASPPKSSNATSEVRDETSATRAAGASSAVRMGMMAPAQKAAAEASKRRAQESGHWKRPIVTKIVPAATFYRAEEYYQQYLEKRGLNQCHLPKA